MASFWSVLRLDPGRALALIAALTVALVAPVRRLEHLPPPGAAAVGLCRAGSTAPIAPDDLPQPERDTCCTLACAVDGVRWAADRSPAVVEAPRLISLDARPGMMLAPRIGPTRNVRAWPRGPPRVPVHA